ncbi:MAG: outer membrane beta-barrel family protein [Dysgonamonadaceae bacterium]|jgi:hypothetical protein|nr:outer membrane beta-barrel family protein [Dysgonamonadaceae bacterium]
MRDNLNSFFNYRKKNLSVYNYFNYGDSRFVTEESEKKIYSNRIIDLYTRNQENGRFGSDNLSLVYDVTPNHSVGVVVGANIGKFSPVSNSHSKMWDMNSELQETVNSIVATQSQYEQYQTAFNYHWQNGKGSTFKLIADYLHRKEISENDYKYVYDREPVTLTEQVRSNREHPMDMFEAEAGCELKLTDSHQLGFGGDFSTRTSNQTVNYQNLTGESWIQDENLSDHYNLWGTNYAAYVTFSSKFGNFLYKAGLRAQQNIIAYDSYKVNRKNTKTYESLYPTVNITYTIDQKQGTNLIFIARRSMNDIPYSAISPVVTRYSTGAAKPRNILSDERIRFDSYDGHKKISGLRRSPSTLHIYPMLKRSGYRDKIRSGLANAKRYPNEIRSGFSLVFTSRHRTTTLLS